MQSTSQWLEELLAIHKSVLLELFGEQCEQEHQGGGV